MENNSDVGEMNELQIINEPGDDVCVFCLSDEVDEFKFGPLYKRSGLVAHYYCVLFSHKLLQNGADYEGFLGFLVQDVKLELLRINKITCFYCTKPNASVRCWYRKCKRNFHFTCGRINKALNQFKGNFKTFCFQHRPKQRIPQKILTEAENNYPACIICYDLVNPTCITEAIWAPCCIKTWYHRDCIQRQALSAGYFFKCAACNNSDKFKQWVEKHGIFVPNQDASWELEPNAFSELETVRYECDVENCICPYGRRYFTSFDRKKHKKNTERRKWEILLCKICASHGTHLACAGSKFTNLKWKCDLCSKVYSEKNCNRKTSTIRNKSKENELNIVDHQENRFNEKSGDEGNASTCSASWEDSPRSKGSAMGKRKKTGMKRKRKRIDVEDGDQLAKKKDSRSSSECNQEKRIRSLADSSDEVSSASVLEADKNLEPFEHPHEDIVNEADGEEKLKTRRNKMIGESIPAGTGSDDVQLAEIDNETINVDLIDLTDHSNDMTEEEKQSIVEVYRNFQLNDIKYRVKKEIYDVSDGESDGSELEIITEKNQRKELPNYKDENEMNGKEIDLIEDIVLVKERKSEPAPENCSHSEKKTIKDRLLKHYFAIVDQENSSCLGEEMENFTIESEGTKKKCSKIKRKSKSVPEKTSNRNKMNKSEINDSASRHSCHSKNFSGTPEGVNEIEIVKIVNSRRSIFRSSEFDSSQHFSDAEDEEIIDIE